jgi:hypothetical protein
MPLRTICALLLLSSLACSQTAQTKHSNTKAEQELRKLTDQWTQVDVNQDKSFLENILADDFVSTSRSGTVRDKKKLLADWRDEHVKSAQNSDVTVRVYSKRFAVVTGLDTTTGKDEKGVEWVQRDRFTTVWVKRNGKWQCVAAHATRRRPPATP